MPSIHNLSWFVVRVHEDRASPPPFYMGGPHVASHARTTTHDKTPARARFHHRLARANDNPRQTLNGRWNVGVAGRPPHPRLKSLASSKWTPAGYRQFQLRIHFRCERRQLLSMQEASR